MTAAFAGSTEAAGAAHLNWPHVSTGPYQSITHGGRYVSNTANDVAVVAYMKYEEIGKAPVGSILAKNSFAILEDGKAAIGPLFTMTKMEEGWNPETGDWRYSMVMPGGSTVGVTKGPNAISRAKSPITCFSCQRTLESRRRPRGRTELERAPSIH